MRWVRTKQIDENRLFGNLKARLVARGFEEEADSVESPTMTKEGFRMILFIASLFGWILGSVDISTAFLQQSEACLKRDLFLQPPKEAGLGPEWVWKALKAPYGTTDAPKSWILAQSSLRNHRCSEKLVSCTGNVVSRTRNDSAKNGSRNFRNFL